MVVHYEATEGVVESANIAMAELARTRGKNMAERIRAIWEPVASALVQSSSHDLGPDQAALVDSLGSDFVGQTSDTGRIVSWGRNFGTWREFVVHSSALRTTLRHTAPYNKKPGSNPSERSATKVT